MRADLPVGVAGANILHAAGETGPAHSGTIAVLLAAPDEKALRALAELVKNSHLVIETDGVHAGQAMALAVPPGPRCTAFGHLPLWRGAKHA